MDSASRLLHLPFKDPEGIQDHVLVHISPTSDDSSRPLDLDLLATQGTEAFVTSLQHSRVSRYRDAESSCSELEWEKYLTSLLLDAHPTGDLDVLAENKDEGYLTIDVRTKVSGRLQHLGTLRLRRSIKARDTVDIFGWCLDNVKARRQLEREVSELKRKYAELEKLVTEETAHFQDLERSKYEFETTHDSFCKDLVNEKKLKIRMLEQVLSTAHVDKEKLSEVASKQSTTVTNSRKGKRKAEGHGSDRDTDDGADKMDVDIEIKDQSHDDEISDVDAGMTTPETASEDEAEPESDSEPEPKKASRSSVTRKKQARASPDPSATTSRKVAKSGQSAQRRKAAAVSEDEDEDEDESPPPRRLPVNKKPAPSPDPADDESTASE